MVEGCGDKCCKYIFLFINLLVFVAGIACLALGIWAAVDKASFLDTLSKIPLGNANTQNVPGLLQSSAYILIVAGAVITLISFLACCGAWRENKCLLGIFAGIVIIFIILLLAAAIVGFVFRGKLTSGLKDGLVKGLEDEYDGFPNSTNPVSRAIDRMQVELECCGIVNYTDYKNATKWVVGKTNIPKSCCMLTNKAAYFDSLKYELKHTQCPTDLADSYISKPCYNAVESELMSKIGAVIGVAIAVFVLMILAVVFACCIMRAISSDNMNVA